MWDKLKEKAVDAASQAVASANQAVSSASAHSKDLHGFVQGAAETVSQFSIGSAVKDFAVKSTQVVEQIDKELTNKNSIYEVASFRVGANAGVVGGMTLQIDFVKTAEAKNISNQRRAYLDLAHPNTGKIMRVLRSAFGDKEIAVIRDPSTGDLLEVDVGRSLILSINNSPVANAEFNAEG